MAIKEENEVTVRVLCSNDELVNYLRKQGFKSGREFSLDDDYYIPSSLNIDNMSAREILSKAIILRYIVDDGKIIQKITYKIKDIDKNGDIISQRAINCDVQNIEDAKKIFEAKIIDKMKKDGIIKNCSCKNNLKDNL